MMISALARASQALEDPRYLERAQATAKFLESHLYDSKTGKLWRSFRAGGPSVSGFLDDYSDLISGLLDLYQDRKSTRLNSSHLVISYAVFCLKKKKQTSSHT